MSATWRLVKRNTQRTRNYFISLAISASFRSASRSSGSLNPKTSFANRRSVEAAEIPRAIVYDGRTNSNCGQFGEFTVTDWLSCRNPLEFFPRGLPN